MNASSEARLSKVHPELDVRVRLLISLLAGKGYPFEVVQGLRTYAEQDALFAQGRTKPGRVVTNARGGYSNHNFGLAVDIAPLRDKDSDGDQEIDWDWHKAFLAINDEAEKAGLEWGGDWKKFIDMPHVQLKGPTVDECRQLFAKGGLKAVWDKVVITPFPSVSVPSKPSRPVLRRGDRGDAVRELQTKLRKHVDVSIDGIFGPGLERALKIFQRQEGLEPDGIAGPAVYKALGL